MDVKTLRTRLFICGGAVAIRASDFHLGVREFDSRYGLM
jgi:hypothetical protein